MYNSIFKLPILAYPFRPFFLIAGVYGVVTIVAWMAQLFGSLTLPVGWSPIYWHGHEMLFGLVTAAIAGFLLTAICNWTGAPPLQGAGLLVMMLVWLSGRLAMWTASWWPMGVVAVVDMLFLPVLAGYALRVLLRHGNRRNLVLVAMLVVLALANAMTHIGFVTGNVVWLRLGEITAFNLVTLLMVIISGRIIPLFTINWLRNNGRKPEDVRSTVAIDSVALISTALLIPIDFFPGLPWLAGSVAAVAAVAHTIRLLGWSGWKASLEPLLWILHLGYAWIVAALALKSLAAFGLVPPSAWNHALGVGGMGTLILGIMTRVALGHTGRALHLPRFAIAIYVTISLAAATRVAAALLLVEFRIGLLIAATAWSLAFAIFVIIYWPILSRPRVDGRPG